MASIDSPLASLTASFVTDIYKPLIRPDADDALMRAAAGVEGVTVRDLYAPEERDLLKQIASGGVTLTGNDLELVMDANLQTVGLYVNAHGTHHNPVWYPVEYLATSTYVCTVEPLPVVLPRLAKDGIHERL